MTSTVLAVTPPPFEDLLASPEIPIHDPTFDTALESTHLLKLWDDLSDLQDYRYESFISAGSSGNGF